MSNNIKIFPRLKKFTGEISISGDTPESDIDDLAHHYMEQVISQIEKQGFSLDDQFFQDFEIVYEMLKATLKRSVGQYHPLQELIDELYEDANSDEGEEDNNTEEGISE